MSNTSQASARINSLLDENSFVEIGGMVTARATDFNMDPKAAPTDGVITGYGLIGGSLVYVYSQDASVMGGSIGEMHAKKIINLYDLAMKTGAPVIGLIDSTGLRLLEATDALAAFGRIYKKKAYEKIEKSKPVFIISGAEDPVGDYGKLTGKLYDFYVDKVQMESVELKLYDGVRHEYLNDVSREAARADILEFCNEIVG